MAREPLRREQPAPLDAKLVPVERALIARAKAIEAKAEQLTTDSLTPAAEIAALCRVGAEFRFLAEELKYW